MEIESVFCVTVNLYIMIYKTKLVPHLRKESSVRFGIKKDMRIIPASSGNTELAQKRVQHG